MKRGELQQLYEQRLDGESINETLARIDCDPPETLDAPTEQENPEQRYIPEPQEELIIPRYKLVQPSSRIEGVEAGVFHNNLTEETFEKLENVVFLKHQSTRVLFNDGDFSGERRCWSANGYYPATEEIKERTGNEPVSSQCACREGKKLKFICPLAEWLNSDGKPDPNGKIAPKCKPSISILGLELETMVPFYVIFHGSSLPEVKLLLRYMGYQRGIERRKGNELQMYHFKIDVNLESVTSSKGKYYLPRFKTTGIISDPKEQKMVENCYEECKEKFEVSENSQNSKTVRLGGQPEPERLNL